MTITLHDPELSPTTRTSRLPDQFQAPPEPKSTLLGAAFRQENAVIAAAQYMLRPQFEPDPEFNFRSRVEASPLALNNPEPFFGVQSDDEFNYVLSKVEQETRDRQRLASAGVGGVATAMMAGFLSPTIFLPAGGIAKAGSALKAGTAGAAWAAVAVGIDETFLQLDQKLRTPTETMLGIGTAAVLGGVIGTAVGRARADDFARFEADMAGTATDRTIYPSSPLSPVGAQINSAVDDAYKSAGGVMKTFGRLGPIDLDKAAAKLSPVTRRLRQEYSDTARWFQAKLSTGGLMLDDNLGGRASAVGGEVNELVKQHATKYYNVLQRENEIWRDYLASVNSNRLEAMIGKTGIMSRKDFHEAIGKTLDINGEAPNEFVKKAADAYREELFLPFFREAKALGMKGFQDVSEEQAMEYLPHAIKKGLVERDIREFEQVLREHYEEQLQATFHKKLEGVQSSLAREEQELADLELTAPQVKEARASLEAEIANLPNRFPGEVGDIASEIRDLRARARATRGDEAKALKEQAKLLEAENKEALKPFRIEERKLRGRFRSLDNTMAGLEKKHRAIIDKISDIEETQLNTLTRAVDAIEKLIRKADNLGPERYRQEIEKLESKVLSAMKTFDRFELQLARLGKVSERLSVPERIAKQLSRAEKVHEIKAKQKARIEKMEGFFDEIAALEAADPTVAQRMLKIARDDILERAQATNNKRAVRLQALREQADALSPTARKAYNENLRAELTDSITTRRLNFLEDLQVKRGATITSRTDPSGKDFLVDGSDITKAVSFEDEAARMAASTAQTMLGDTRRLPSMSLLGERGPELARTLNIDPTRVWSNGRTYGDFLERDIERVARRYVRTMAPDIELHRAFDTVNPLSPDSPIMRRINEEYLEWRRVNIDEADISDAAKKKKLKAYEADRQQMITDFQAEIDRMRHTRGVPDDPTAISYRMGRAALNLNTLRLMGGVVVASMPDLARLTFKNGLLTTFKHTFIPMIRDFQTFKMTAREAKYAGTALDLALHGRSSALFDIFDEVEFGSSLERGLQWSTNNFGKYVAFFDQWNVGMKHLAAAGGNAKFMMHLEDFMTGKAKKKDIAFLAAHSIDEDAARLIWTQMNGPGGATRVNGAFLPNTENWGKDALKRMNEAPDAATRAAAALDYDKAIEAQRIYRAALSRHVDTTIVTPGLERPLWMDKNMAWRLVAQFRSFTFSSTQQVLMAAAQDARIGNGGTVMVAVAQSLALGALSYYTWAMARGGDAKKEMLAAIENEDWEKWADEAILRSGLIGVLGEVQRVAERTPGIDQYATLSGKSSSRSPFKTPVFDSLGPTFGLVEDLQRIAVSTLSPDQDVSTYAIRNVTPYQNVSYLAWMFDAMRKKAEEALP